MLVAKCHIMAELLQDAQREGAWRRKRYQHIYEGTGLSPTLSNWCEVMDSVLLDLMSGQHGYIYLTTTVLMERSPDVKHLKISLSTMSQESRVAANVLNGAVVPVIYNNLVIGAYLVSSSSSNVELDLKKLDAMTYHNRNDAVIELAAFVKRKHDSIPHKIMYRHHCQLKTS